LFHFAAGYRAIQFLDDGEDVAQQAAQVRVFDPVRKLLRYLTYSLA
jgi:hypothetical protein